jgi:hypothetical protein
MAERRFKLYSAADNDVVYDLLVVYETEGEIYGWWVNDDEPFDGCLVHDNYCYDTTTYLGDVVLDVELDLA